MTPNDICTDKCLIQPSREDSFSSTWVEIQKITGMHYTHNQAERPCNMLIYMRCLH